MTKCLNYVFSLHQDYYYIENEHRLTISNQSVAENSNLDYVLKVSVTLQG